MQIIPLHILLTEESHIAHLGHALMNTLRDQRVMRHLNTNMSLDTMGGKMWVREGCFLNFAPPPTTHAPFLLTPPAQNKDLVTWC